ncbi:hypothetical protein N7478_008607 [Penicillium angulare]|uniref:uncharacterized protein n=1 Tax=Penicillium angulare TaxID=116970 RepID=UPI00253FFAA4|nr:uncharacterized protein N7478_008607 [Penicillium angulare]KAJ5273482.1 hypothetical protein N7478_008607 [Penicillium angulare]
MVRSYAQVVVMTLGLASLALSAAVDKNLAGVSVERDTVPEDVGDSSRYVPRCNSFYKVQQGDTCWDIITQNEDALTMDQLLCWNPDINPWCSNLIPGRNICTGVANSASFKC